jgi:hypothetical protein
MEQNQAQYQGPERRKSEAPYNGKERRRLDWPFKPPSAAERKDGIAPTTTPARADVEPSSPGPEKKAELPELAGTLLPARAVEADGTGVGPLRFDTARHAAKRRCDAPALLIRSAPCHCCLHSLKPQWYGTRASVGFPLALALLPVCFRKRLDRTCDVRSAIGHERSLA